MIPLTSLPEVCSLPWVHTEINLQNNTISPCCKFQGKLGNASTAFNVVWFNEYTTQLRKDLAANISRGECSKCSSNNAFTYKSWQTKLYKQIGILDNININEPDLPKVFHFSLSNVCNLACRMCNPGSSSKINSLAQRSEFSKFFKPIAVDNKFPLENLTGSFKNAEYVIISGGEPLVNTDCVDLVKLILKETSNLKAVAFSTNMTVLNKELLEILSGLDISVRFNISLDGPPHIHEYIRGCKWNNIVDNIKHIRSNYPNFKFSVNSTVSALNVGYVPEFLESLNNIEETCKIEFIEIMPSPVFNDYLHVGVLPAEIKNQYKEHLIASAESLFKIRDSRLLMTTALNLLSVDSTYDLDRFVEYVSIFDSTVNTDLKSVYPEFKDLYNMAPRVGIEPT